jgi:hypothetical protein
MTSRMYTNCAITGNITTTNATPSVICSFDLANPLGNVATPINNTAIYVEGIVCAQISGSAYGSAKIAKSFKIVSGSVTSLFAQQSLVAGSGGLLLGDVGITTALGTIDNNSTLIRLNATGILATTILWTGYLWIYTCEF